MSTRNLVLRSSSTLCIIWKFFRNYTKYLPKSYLRLNLTLGLVVSSKLTSTYSILLVERAFSSPIPLQLFQRFVQLLAALPLETLGPEIRDNVSVRIILVSFITGHRPSQSPG